MSELTCQELVELVTEYLDGTLAAADRARFDEHLAECEGCTIYVAQFEQVISLTGTLEPDDVTAEARDALLAQFRAWKSR
jgi:anti-sigma factor RsiW